MSIPKTLPRRISALITLIVTPSIALAGCSNSNDTSASGSTPAITVSTGAGGNMSGCIPSESFNKHRDYLPDKAIFAMAKNVHISYHKSYKIMTLGRQGKPAQMTSTAGGSPSSRLLSVKSRRTPLAEAFARTAASLRADNDALDGLAPAPSGPDLPVEELAGLPAALRIRALRTWLASRGARALTGAHLAAVDALVTDWHGQGPTAIPGGSAGRRLQVHRAGGILRAW